MGVIRHVTTDHRRWHGLEVIIACILVKLLGAHISMLKEQDEMIDKLFVYNSKTLTRYLQYQFISFTCL